MQPKTTNRGEDNTGRKSSGAFFRHGALPLLVLLVGLLGSAGVTYQLRRISDARDQERFDRLAEQKLNAIKDRLDTGIALLRGTTGLFAASPEVSRADFEAFVRRLYVNELYPGIQGIGFARRFGADERDAIERAMRAQGEEAFAIRPADERATYTAILYLEPLDRRNQAAIGFDMFTEPTRRAAMERARDTGQAAMSGKVELVQEIDRNKQPGFLIYLPVYVGGRVPATVEERRRRLQGWAYSPFRAGDLFGRALPGEGSDPELSYHVFDGAEAAPAGLLYSSGPEPGGSDAHGVSAYTAVKPLEIAGRTWTVGLAATPTFARASGRGLAPFVLAAGTLATLLLAGATWAQSRATRAAEKAREDLRELNATLESRVDERTAELQQARDTLRLVNRNLEAIVAARVSDLQAANEEIQRFAYIVSHDLRAPLVNVMGFTSELDTARGEIERFLQAVEQHAPNLVSDHTRAAVKADLSEAIGFIRSSTAKMDRLINAILKLSREGRRVLTPEPIDMRELLEGCRRSLAHQLEASGAELTVEDVADLASDRLAVEQVFGNLLENAVKYLLPDRPGRIHVRGRPLGTHVRFEIEDNGRGIEAKDRERVFELFRRAGIQDKPGEGIGLAHVRALVRRLGGTITVASEPGRGSTFVVTLPKTLVADQETAA